MAPCYLIYHPKRPLFETEGLKVYHDKFGGNEDPYLWNHNFLHTYCHITQLSNIPGQINFWVSADKYSQFNHLYCDCVFVIESKHFWTERNYISQHDPIVDNAQTYEHHYKWANYGQHPFTKRRRYTLKANAELSFQPQDNNASLIDILPFLNKNGITKEYLLKSMTSKKGSRPLKLSDDLGNKLYQFLLSNAPIKIYGKDLIGKHPHPHQINSSTDRNCN